MAITRVQHIQALNVSTTNVISATLSGVTSGNLLTVGALTFANGTDTATCSDGTSYTATPASPATDGNVHSRTYIFYLPNAGAGTHAVTVTWVSSATAGNLDIRFTEWSGIATASPLDIDGASVSGTGMPSTTISTPSITPTGTGELLYCMVAAGGTATSVNGAWSGQIVGGDADAWILGGTTSPTAVNMTQSSSFWSSVSAAFKTGGAAAAAVPGFSSTTAGPSFAI